MQPLLKDWQPMFRIDFIGEPFSHQHEAFLLGRIRDDGMEEQFWASTTF